MSAIKRVRWDDNVSLYYDVPEDLLRRLHVAAALRFGVLWESKAFPGLFSFGDGSPLQIDHDKKRNSLCQNRWNSWSVWVSERHDECVRLVEAVLGHHNLESTGD
jgi:hypothetical protein